MVVDFFRKLQPLLISKRAIFSALNLLLLLASRNTKLHNNKRKQKYLLLITLFSISPFSYAKTDLLTVYQQAFFSDPIFAQARADNLSTQENTAISKAGLLPNVALSGSATYTHIDEGDPSTNGTNNQYQLQLQQPIFNYASWIAYQAAQLSGKSAYATFGASLQDLIARVALAYLNVAQSQDLLQLSQENQQVLFAVYQQTILQYKAGLSKGADLTSAQAAYENSKTDVINAQNDYANALSELETITGISYNQVATLKNNFPLPMPNPNNLQQWQQVAQQQNLTLLAARYTVLSEQAIIKQERAGSYPTVAAGLGYSGNQSQNNGLGNTSSNGGVATLSLNLPIYQGGLVVAQTKQAIYNYQSSFAQFMQADRNAINLTQQGFNGVIAAINKIQAGQLALQANQSALHDMKVSYEAGIRTMVDVLYAEQNLYQAQQNYVQAQYDYFSSLINLKQAAGTLSVNDLQAINKWLN